MVNRTGGGKGTTRDVHGVVHIKGKAKTATPAAVVSPAESLLVQADTRADSTTAQLIDPNAFSPSFDTRQHLVSALQQYDPKLARKRQQEMDRCKTEGGKSEVADQILEDLDQCAPEGYYYGTIGGDHQTLGFWPVQDPRQ